VAKRILAPHLEPLARQSPWQAARDELQQQAQASSNAHTVAGTSTAAAPATQGSIQGALGAARSKTPVPMRRPYAFLRRLTHHWLVRLTSLLQYGLSSEDNAVRVYFDGDEAYQAMFDAVAAAQERVCLETFMFKPDRVGLRMIRLMEEAAARGCQVMVLYDSAGSFSMSAGHLAKLSAMPTAHVVAYNPVLGALFRRTQKDLSHRTHRKILVADNVAFAGGMNCTEQYAGPRLGINEFRDTHARIRGPAVEHLCEVFYQSLQEAHAHDRDTWRHLFAAIRTRTAARITQSSLFSRTLEYMAESGSDAGAQASKFFSATRERQKLRLEQLHQEELTQAQLAALKQDATRKVRAMRLRSGEPAAVAEGDEAQEPAMAPAHPPERAQPTARASLKRMRRFVGSRLRVLAQSSASSHRFEQADAVVRAASVQWRDAWKRVQNLSHKAREIARDELELDLHSAPTQGQDKKLSADAAAGAAADANEQPSTPHHPSLPSTAMSTLTASLTATPSLPMALKNAAANASSLTAAAATTPASAEAAASSANSADEAGQSAVSSTGGSAPIPVSPEFFPVFLQILPSNTLRSQFAIHHALMDMLDASRHYVLLTNPFLLPPRGIERALLAAGRRGVTVRIVTSGKSDTPYMRWSSSHIYHRFLDAGIQLFEYQPRILHAKTLTADGIVSSVASFNLDFLSSHKLLEVSMAMVSAPLAKHMETQFDEDLKHCKPVTKESLKRRTVWEKMLHATAFYVSRFAYGLML